MGNHKMLHVKENKTKRKKQAWTEWEERENGRKKDPTKARGRKGHPLTDLAKRALHATKEVSLLQPIVVAADVMDLKPQALHLFKVKVHSKQFWIHWVYAGANHLCSVNLQGERERKPIRD